jgi:hypothetical protein
MILNLHTSVRCLGHMLLLSLALFLCLVFTDPGTSENFLGTSEFGCLCGSRLPDSGTSGLGGRNLRGLGEQKSRALEFKAFFLFDDFSFIGLATFNISKAWILAFL